MDDLGPPVPCVGCGTPTPRAEMFGLAPELRCGACADALRTRIHPAAVRRGPTTFRPVSARPDARVASGLLALAAVLWLAWEVDTPLKALVDRLFTGDLRMVAWGQSVRILGHPHPWQFLAWAFLHGGIAHLLFNGIAVLQIGRWIEWGWGGRTLTVLLVGAATAGTAAGWLVNGVPTIGLSGGLFALDGWLLAQRRHHVVASALVNRVFLHSLVASSLLMVLLTELGGLRISHVGHAAGFLWGLAAGISARSPQRTRDIGFALLGLATLALLLLPSYVEPLHWRVQLFGGKT